MKINWAQNPLATTIELDATDLKILKLSIRVFQLEEYLYDTQFYLNEKNFNLDKARTISNIDDERFEQHIERIFDWTVEELTTGVHSGDCTCIPMSCTKCLAEDFLGIDTLKGLGKHGGYYIDDTFKGSISSINEAINHLENYAFTKNEQWIKSDPDGSEWNVHLPRWKAEAANALKWLKAYKEEHFSND